MGTTLERGALLHKRYRIVDILGQGGMGSVYRAIDENLGVDVAVKENLFTTDEYARQFRLEAVLLANLRHPNLPRVTDHFIVGEQGQYLVMDFIEGEDLRQRMERLGPLSEQEAILIGAAMCSALQYLHTRKPVIIHRDVKPGNVRITPDGHVYLVDFGLAKLVQSGQATTTGARAMTPGYSPPEQYGTARTDSRTDVYSLGATLYAALSGTIPEDGLARAMDSVELTPLREHNSKISPEIAAAIEKAMAVRPQDRFQSAEEFKQALLISYDKTQIPGGEILVEPPPQASESASRLEALPRQTNGMGKKFPRKKVPAAPRGSSPARKGRKTGCWITLTFSVLILLLAAASLIVFWQPISKALPPFLRTSTATRVTATVRATDTLVVVIPTTTSSSTPTTVRTPTPTWTASLTPTPTFTPTITETPTLTPTPLGGGYGQIAFASSRAGVPQIFIMRSDGSGQVQLTELPEGACQPDWSPDGSQIVFTSPCPKRQEQYPGSHLYTIQTDGTNLLALPAAEGGDFDPAWSPDGTRIVFTSLRDGSPQIYVLSLTDNTVTTLTKFSNDNIFPEWSRQPAWSPDGARIAYTATRLGVTQIWVMTTAGHDRVQLVRRGGEVSDFLPRWSPDGKTILFSETRGSQAIGRLMTFPIGGNPSSDAALFHNGSYATNAEYSPDGGWVVFESTQDGANYDIYRMTSYGNDGLRLTSEAGQNFDPAWRSIGTP